jgi:hypothetical protein
MSTPDAVTRLQALIAERPALADPLRGLTDPALVAERLAAIGAENGLTVKAADLRAHFETTLAKAQAPGELSDAQLDGVAGGGVADAVLFSIFTLGIGCAVVSAVAGANKRNCGADLERTTLYAPGP